MSKKNHLTLLSLKGIFGLWFFHQTASTLSLNVFCFFRNFQEITELHRSVELAAVELSIAGFIQWDR
jgi:hypothetical protein